MTAAKILGTLALNFTATLTAQPAGTNAAHSLRADGYRGIWFTPGQFSKHGDKYSGGLGTCTANQVPLAVYSPQADKTFFAYGGTLPGQRHLLIMASCYDHKTGRVPRPDIQSMLIRLSHLVIGRSLSAWLTTHRGRFWRAIFRSPRHLPTRKMAKV